MHDESFWGNRYPSRNEYKRGGFDTAQICVNGHVINDYCGLYSDLNKTFCDTCGAATITTCQSCNATIRGSITGRMGGSYTRPSFCEDCGKPYPWTQSIQDSAYELIELSLSLDQVEKNDFKNSVNDLIVQSPKTNVAQVKFVSYAKKAGTEVAKGLRDVLVDVVSETVKKAIWGS